MKILFPNKAKKIQDKFFEFSFNDKEPKPEDYKLLDSSSAMHYLASIYNWDDGTEVLDWIISNPKCDKGTVVMIFWRAEPADYTIYQNEIEADYNAEVFLLLKKIIGNFETGFYKKEQIHYDPTQDGHNIEHIENDAKWKIPEFLKKNTKGGTVLYLPDPFAVMKWWWSNYKGKQHRKRRKKRLMKK